jgi:hypothetical protein
MVFKTTGLAIIGRTKKINTKINVHIPASISTIIRLKAVKMILYFFILKFPLKVDQDFNFAI